MNAIGIALLCAVVFYKNTMPQYIIRFAQFHPEFRLEELQSLGGLEKIEFNIIRSSKHSPFLIVSMKNDSEAKKLVQRSILVKDISILWASSDSLSKLLSNIKSGDFMKQECYQTESFKFLVDAYGKSVEHEEQVKLINSFAFLGYRGPIDLKNPKNTFVYFEDYSHIPDPQERVNASPCHVYFGVLLGTGLRNIVSKYDLKKRKYLGTTSMDAELSLIMANQALARPGTLILDPFVGTGSFLISCSHFGACTIGSDIDGRQIRGKGSTCVESNIEQYGLNDMVLGTLVADIAHHPLRDNFRVDAIVCDVNLFK